MQLCVRVYNSHRTILVFFRQCKKKSTKKLQIMHCVVVEFNNIFFHPLTPRIY